jgi:hypothetical protein
MPPGIDMPGVFAGDACPVFDRCPDHHGDVISCYLFILALFVLVQVAMVLPVHR